MSTTPKQYKKAEFIDYLNEIRVDEKLINKFKQLPETLSHKNADYMLNIVVTFYNDGGTHYTFELNYFSPVNIEFLFPYKIKNDIKLSIDTLFDEVIAFNNKPL